MALPDLKNYLMLRLPSGMPGGCMEPKSLRFILKVILRENKYRQGGHITAALIQKGTLTSLIP